jgi:hypothetical protein
MQDDQ